MFAKRKENEKEVNNISDALGSLKIKQKILFTIQFVQICKIVEILLLGRTRLPQVQVRNDLFFKNHDYFMFIKL
jgi:hypothetical protein